MQILAKTILKADADLKRSEKLRNKPSQSKLTEGNLF